MYEEGNKESFDAVIHQVLQSDHSIIRHRALTYAKKNTVESITFSMLKDLFIYYGE